MADKWWDTWFSRAANAVTIGIWIWTFVGASVVTAISKFLLDIPLWLAILVGGNAAFLIFGFSYVARLASKNLGQIEGHDHESKAVKSPVNPAVKERTDGHPQIADESSTDDFPKPKLRCVYGGVANLTLMNTQYPEYFLVVENEEGRYDSTVHNLRAEILFRPFRGEDVLIKPATFVQKGFDAEHQVERTWFRDHISLGMKKNAYILLFRTVFDKRFFAFDYDGENDPAFNKQLAWGEWEITTKLYADNARAETRLKVILDPNGTINATPLP